MFANLLYYLQIAFTILFATATCSYTVALFIFNVQKYVSVRYPLFIAIGKVIAELLHVKDYTETKVAVLEKYDPIIDSLITSWRTLGILETPELRAIEHLALKQMIIYYKIQFDREWNGDPVQPMSTELSTIEHSHREQEMNAIAEHAERVRSGEIRTRSLSTVVYDFNAASHDATSLVDASAPAAAVVVSRPLISDSMLTPVRDAPATAVVISRSPSVTSRSMSLDSLTAASVRHRPPVTVDNAVVRQQVDEPATAIILPSRKSPAAELPSVESSSSTGSGGSSSGSSAASTVSVAKVISYGTIRRSSTKPDDSPV